MGTIANVWNVFEDKEQTIEKGEGEVMLLDFWATWCPPCQAPMAHNQEMLKEHGDKWGGKVRILGLSIDNDAATIKAHVEKKDWKLVEHYHVRRAGCIADKNFGVQGVPHCALVNRDGIIVWMGHPASRQNLVDDFDKLLAGEMP